MFYQGLWKVYPKGADYVISVGVIKLPYASTTYDMVLIGHTLNFIYSLIQPFEKNYARRTLFYKEKMIELFKNILLTIPETNPVD